MDTTKPGVKTTEFWTTLLTHAIAVLALFVGIDSDKVNSVVPTAALVLSAVAQVFYSHGRAKVKSSSTTTIVNQTFPDTVTTSSTGT